MAILASMALTAATFTATSLSRSSCESKPHNELSPANVGGDNIEEVAADHDIDEMPIYTADQVAENNGEDGRPVWMTYGGVVYDVTDFLSNHPGGREKIIMAAGSAIEPFWHLYRQHFASDLPMKLMEHMMVGRLLDEDQDAIDEQMEELQKNDDPYEKEPERHADLFVHGDTPMNAEVPAHILTQNYLTPPSLFYIRHHHPVPFLKDVGKYNLEINLSAYGKGTLKFSLNDLKTKLEKVEVTTTLQCSGNRRSGFNDVQRTSGTAWGQGAISTAKWGGVRLSDALKLAGLDNPVQADNEGYEHLRFHALDGMSVSIPLAKASDPYGDCIIAWEMNGEPLPRDHGYPLRIIVPGYAAVRNIKWVEKIELATSDAEGPWQRGLNYKILPPAVTDAKEVKLDVMPSLTESSLFSGITHIQKEEIKRGKDRKLVSTKSEPGDTVKVKVSGWAWAGGGRNIVRVDLTSDNGKTWKAAEIVEGGNQRFGRAWAWVFWECELPAMVGEDGKISLASKAVDMAFNVQPEKCDHSWNVRGLGNNSWFRTSAIVD